MKGKIVTPEYADGISSTGTIAAKGPLAHSGTTLGVFGATPASQDTGWSNSNATTTKTLNVSTANLNDVANVLATLMTTLKNYGILGS